MSDKKLPAVSCQLPAGGGASETLSLYVHIPFCVKKCFYCDFNSGPASDHQKKIYLDALQREIEASPWRGARARTVFVGGGTPSELSGPQLARLMTALRSGFDLTRCSEATIECNPGSVDGTSFEAMLEAGFDRISLGVQSFHDTHLGALGRIHDAAAAKQAFSEARAAGVANLNLDLIFGLPEQTLDEWRRDLETALDLAPEHLSLYALAVEPGTEFGRRQQAGLLPVIEDDRVAEMFELNVEKTGAAGYTQYEISNFCRPGRECRHNLVYWRNEPYLGLGVSAASFLAGRRWSNTANWERYCGGAGRVPASAVECLEGAAAAGEAAMLGLRTADGVSTAELSARYQVDFEDAFGGQIEFLVTHGLLQRAPIDRLLLTPRGQLLASEVGMRFLA